MSLAYSIKTVKDLAHAFAAAEEFMSALSSKLYPEARNSYIMDPNDDFYVVPYCFMRTTDRQARGGEGFLVFSSMVPFMKKREHETAYLLVKKKGYHDVPFVDTIENFKKGLEIGERDIYTFTSDGCVPTAQDVSQELEDTAIRVVCDLMKWRYPHNWRKKRAEVSYYFTGWNVMDLAKYDSRRGKKEQLQRHHQLHHQVMQQQRQQQRYYQEQQEQWYDATQYAKVPENTNEEKKDSPTLDYLPLPPVHTPIQQKDTGGGFFERNADIFGSNQTFIPNRYNHNNSKYFEDDDGNTFISNNDTYDDYDNDFLYDADVGI